MKMVAECQTQNYISTVTSSFNRICNIRTQATKYLLYMYTLILHKTSSFSPKHFFFFIFSHSFFLSSPIALFHEVIYCADKYIYAAASKCNCRHFIQQMF